MAGAVSLWAQSDLSPEALATNKPGSRSNTETKAIPQPEGKVFPHSISARLLFSNFGVENAAGRSLTNGFEFAYLYEYKPWLHFAAPLKLGQLNDDELLGAKRTFFGLDATSRVSYAFLNDRLRPFALTGFGLGSISGKGAQIQLPLAAGLEFRVTDAASVSAQMERRFSPNSDFNSGQLAIGVHFNLGRGRFRPEFWDTDGDGIMDHEDQCLTIAGPKSTGGCPDTDGDGIGDAADPCPLHYASPGQNGCPDADKDGVPDPLDECPNVAGELSYAGCPAPDQDQDGFPDEIDECPDQAGRLLGCPDADADGINDKEDECPKQPGPKAVGGCPDRDNDGVPDHLDNCPLLPGKLNGCPDRDNDGVDDASDRCPNIAGEAKHDGCPEIMSNERNMFEFAVRAIGFAPASAVLEGKGFETLEGLAEVMNSYPEYKVRITGHADFEELVTNRTTFSEERAKACAAFLKSKGVDASRILIEGHGAGRPIVRQGTAEERAVNRRVEVDLYVP